jgi:tetratricopeptide (TPR) repeat protein
MAIFIVCSAATFMQADVYEDGLKHYRAGRYTAAIETLERKANRSAGEHALLGWSYLRAGFIEEAKRSFHAALALQSDLADAHCGMGYAFFRSGDYDQARLALDRALALAPSNVDCLVGKGLVLRRQGDNTHAVEWFDRALALDKTNSTAIEEKRKILGAKVETERAPAVTEALAMYRRNELKEALPLLQKLGSDLRQVHGLRATLLDRDPCTSRTS